MARWFYYFFSGNHVSYELTTHKEKEKKNPSCIVLCGLYKMMMERVQEGRHYFVSTFFFIVHRPNL